MLDNKIVNQVVNALLNQNGGRKEPTKLYGTVVVVDDKKYVKLDGSDTLTGIVEGTEVMADDRVLVSIENHQAVVLSNITSPASARTATNFMDFSEEGLVIGQLTTPGGAPQSIIIGSLGEGEQGIYLRVGENVIAKFIGDEFNYSKIEFGPFTAQGETDEYLGILDALGLNVYKNYQDYDTYDAAIRMFPGYVAVDNGADIVEIANGSVIADNGCNAKIVEVTATKSSISVEANSSASGTMTADIPDGYRPCGIIQYQITGHPAYYLNVDVNSNGTVSYNIHNPSSGNWTGIALTVRIACIWAG